MHFQHQSFFLLNERVAGQKTTRVVITVIERYNLKSMKPKFFNSSAALRKWFEKNHQNYTELWVGFYKDGTGIKQKEALDQAICFGWIFGVIKRIDELSYAVKFTKRKEKSKWSDSNIERATALKKKGLMRKAGLQALEGRDKGHSEAALSKFSIRHLRLFKSNTPAWTFFESQRESYRRYTTMWVNQAKREETKLKRLNMLIEDSANGSKLKRIVEANEKVKPKYPAGRTPIEAARNIGPMTASELRNVGIKTVEELQAMGWEQAFQVLCEVYPHRINLNMLTGLIGAVENIDWRKIDSRQKAEAKALIIDMKRAFRF
jgi:uncharacterized protein YdeI (YjbR/CyaY-like superfamily)